MVEVNNGSAGRLTIEGVHDGACGIQAGARLQVAFRWGRTGKRPELAVGAEATLDGRRCRVRSVARSGLSEGFYLAELEPAAD